MLKRLTGRVLGGKLQRPVYNGIDSLNALWKLM